MASSTNDTVYVVPGATIVDGAGNSWYLHGGQVVENGVVDQGTANVIAIAYVNGRVWQQNSADLWYEKVGAAPGSYDGWSPATSTDPLPRSADGTVIGNGASSPLVDASGNLWSISAGGQVTENGTIDPLTGNVVEMAIKGGVIWQENTAHLWYGKVGNVPGSYDGWSAGTYAAPVPVTRTWVGGGSNSASAAADWVAPGAPVAGDTLRMASGTMNVSGAALRGDAVNMTSNGMTATFNLTSNAGLTLNASVYGDAVTVNVAAGSAWHGGMSGGPGTSLIVQGGGDFDNSASRLDGNATINATVVGSGTIGVYSAHALGKLEFMHGVAATQTVAADGYELYGSEYGTVQIDDPANYHASTILGYGEFILQNLHADSYTLQNGMLSLFSGKAVVDTMTFGLEVINGAAVPHLGTLTVAQAGNSVILHTGGPLPTASTLLGIHV